MRDYSKTPTDQLVRSFRNLDQDCSTQTLQEEFARMARMDEISEELGRRGLDCDGHIVVHP